MWQPTRAQWPVIWITAALLVLAWPPERGRSLLITLAAWAVDPTNALPTLPAVLPLVLDDDGDAVAAHDEQEREYYRVRESSRLARLRMTVKEGRDPFDPTLERQLLVGLAVLSALGVWRLSGR
jgi:hypothetical protein